jgi:hypothetical protein
MATSPLPAQDRDTMTTGEPESAAPPPTLRWFQYRLRSLFILTTLVAITCSWAAVEMQNQRKQKAAAETLKKAGGRVDSEVTWLGRLLRDDSLVRVRNVDFNGQSSSNDVLTHLQGLRQAGLPHLQRLRQLQYPWLDNIKITDTELVHLQELRQLESLGLGNTTVTDAGLAHLQGLQKLLALQLYNTRVTDAGLVHLQGLKQLQGLGLGRTQVTDAGLVHLQGLQKLQWIDLSKTQVTVEGITKLQKALPKCTIVR